VAYRGDEGPFARREDSGGGADHAQPASSPFRPGPPPAATQSTNDPSPCPEVDCLRGRLHPGLIERAERRARLLGVGADEVLIAGGLISETDYIDALCGQLGVLRDPMDDFTRMAAPCSDEELLEVPRTGRLTLLYGKHAVLAIAPRGLQVRKLIAHLKEHPGAAAHIRFTTPAEMSAFARRYANDALGHHAARALHTDFPEFSAARSPRLLTALVVGLALITSAIIWPGPVLLGIDLILSALFAAWIAFRILCTATPAVPSPPVRSQADRNLPVYTVIAAVYREAKAVPGLLASLRKLNYPPEKLDIKIVIEADDRATRDALDRQPPSPPFEVFVAPAVHPRTKPKALNAALTAARGRYTVIYDAEDRPEPDQLRRALDIFRSQDKSLACVQARLTIDNTGDSWLTRMFTAEYAGHFDAFLPGLAARGHPIPLGGTSNHFDTAALRKLYAWDPYNVTEDADLGIRLARCGYRTSVCASSTYEEAPVTIEAWVKQRTRWMKGWMQTWYVHMRTPLRLYDQLGLRGFIAFQLAVGGNALSALIHPAFIIWNLHAIIAAPPLATELDVALAWLHAFIIAGGYAAAGWIALKGLRYRNLMQQAWAIALIPLYWLLLSTAAWRAAYQLFCAPHTWEKTEHGLAKTSRLTETNQLISRAPPRIGSTTTLVPTGTRL